MFSRQFLYIFKSGIQFWLHPSVLQTKQHFSMNYLHFICDAIFLLFSKLQHFLDFLTLRSFTLHILFLIFFSFLRMHSFSAVRVNESINTIYIMGLFRYCHCFINCQQILNIYWKLSIRFLFDSTFKQSYASMLPATKWCCSTSVLYLCMFPLLGD